MHVGPAQVEHAVREPRGFGQVVVVKLKRGGDARVEHDQFMAQHLDLAAFEAVIGGARRALAHDALDLYAKLVANVFGGLKGCRAVGVADHLYIAFAVAQVDENHAAVVTPAIDPAAQADALAEQGFGDQTAIVRTHLGDDGHENTWGSARLRD